MHKRRGCDGSGIVDLDDGMLCVVHICKSMCDGIRLVQVRHVSYPNEIMSKRNEKATVREGQKRTPCRVINITPVIPSIEERGAGVFPQRYIDSIDEIKLQGNDSQGEDGSPHDGREGEGSQVMLVMQINLWFVAWAAPEFDIVSTTLSRCTAQRSPSLPHTLHDKITGG